jgi:hypothetical protein
VFGDNVHTGGAVGGCCQVTVILDGWPSPAVLAAVTEYGRAPGTACVVVQMLVELVQPDHTKVVGLFVHAAVSVSVLLTAGAVLLAEIAQYGVGPTGGGGVVPPPLERQSTVTPTFGLAPALLLARSA